MTSMSCGSVSKHQYCSTYRDRLTHNVTWYQECVTSVALCTQRTGNALESSHMRSGVQEALLPLGSGAFFHSMRHHPIGTARMAQLSGVTYLQLANHEQAKLPQARRRHSQLIRCSNSDSLVTARRLPRLFIDPDLSYTSVVHLRNATDG